MRLLDLLESTLPGHMPHLFLDMDGVQADFFGHWARHHGVKHYKTIPHPKAAIDELAVSTEKKVYNFFRELDPLPGGLAIISWLRTNQIPFTVLSAPLRGPHSGASIKAKKDWLDQYNPGTSQDAIFTDQKFRYAKTGDKPNVLVDDFDKYLLAWDAAGGIAVRHDDDVHHHTVATLEELYAPHLK